MKLGDIIHNFQADICCFAEHRINFSHGTVTNSPGQLFCQEAIISTTQGHNTHENILQSQEGGTMMLTIGKLNQFTVTIDWDKDPTGLGRWVSTLYLGKGGCSTRVITVYNPCYSWNPLSGSTFQQHRRLFIGTHHNFTCPWKWFQEDLIHQMKAWKNNSKNLILCMDGNQHVYARALGKELMDPLGLALTEPIEMITGQKIGPTFFQGSKPIDVVWASSSLTITNVCVLPVGFGAGNHHMFVLDITNHSMIGVEKTPIQCPPQRRLSTRSPRSVHKYNTRLTKMLTQHLCLEQLHSVCTCAGFQSTTDTQRILNNLDSKVADYMQHLEWRCLP